MALRNISPVGGPSDGTRVLLAHTTKTRLLHHGVIPTGEHNGARATIAKITLSFKHVQTAFHTPAETIPSQTGFGDD